MANEVFLCFLAAVLLSIKLLMRYCIDCADCLLVGLWEAATVEVIDRFCQLY